MISVPTFCKKINYKEIVTALVDVMSANFKDFAADKVRFNETISLLENELAESSSPPVSNVTDAICQQIGSVLLFSFFLGFKANFDHYINPIGNTFLDVDPEVYLREDVAKRLPDYQNGQRIQELFYAKLSPTQQDRYVDIITYITHLETVGPKLAHFYGYMLGNQLFPCIIPAYSEDLQLTLCYRHMLERHLGVMIQ